MSLPDNFKIGIASSGLGHVTRGVEGWAEEIAYGLSSRGVETTLYKGSGEPKSKIETIIKCLQRDSDMNKRILKYMPSFAWRIGFGSSYQTEETTFALNLFPQLMRKKIDILHLKDPWLALILHRLYKIGLIKTKIILAHGTEEPYEFIRKFDFVQHLAPHHLAEARQSGINSISQFVIPNFVDIERFKSGSNGLRKELNIPDDAFVILSVAAIKRTHKRIDYLLKEIVALKNQHSNNIYLIIVGSQTEETAELMKAGKKLLDNQVIFMLNRPKETMPAVYATADIFALCSLKEMMPNALLEALACGLPAICHKYPVHEWIIGDGGECIDMEKDGELATTIEKYFDNNHRTKIGKKAREQAINNFSKEKIIDQTIKMYEEVLNGK